MIHSIYAVLMTDKLEKSNLFYKTYLGFTETFSSDWYISLSHPDGGELALIDAAHETIPVSNRSVVNGMILNIEVENATLMHDSIKKQNASIIVMPLRDEEYGQRHFMIQDPNNMLIDIIELIPPSAEFKNNYTGGL